MIELDKDALEAAKNVWRGRWEHTQIPKLLIEDMIEMYLTTMALKNSKYDFLERTNSPLKRPLWERIFHGK